MHLVVIAKEPVPGRVKTRLCPPCTPVQAAAIAEAALADTLATVAATPATSRTIALDGRPGPWLPEGIDVVAQRRGDLADRLHGAFADVLAAVDRRGDGGPSDAGDGRGEPVVLVGMDTPQVSTAALLAAGAALRAGSDAVLGPAPDGGYWLVGLRHLHPEAFVGVPMSTETTGADQHARLVRCGYRVATVAPLVDVDTMVEARAVAASVPGSRFARAVDAVGAGPGWAVGVGVPRATAAPVARRAR